MKFRTLTRRWIWSSVTNFPSKSNDAGTVIPQWKTDFQVFYEYGSTVDFAVTLHSGRLAGLGAEHLPVDRRRGEGEGRSIPGNMFWGTSNLRIACLLCIAGRGSSLGSIRGISSGGGHLKRPCGEGRGLLRADERSRLLGGVWQRRDEAVHCSGIRYSADLRVARVIVQRCAHSRAASCGLPPFHQHTF